MMPSSSKDHGKPKRDVAVRHSQVTLRQRSSPSSAVGGPRGYGELVDSQEVHEEIRTLGKKVSRAVATHLPRDGTSEAQTLAAVRQFGPSTASRQMLNRENEAAMLAFEQGVYVVWRCLPERVGGADRVAPGHLLGHLDHTMTQGAPRVLSGATDDFCTRLGRRSTCFCGHNLARHAMPGSSGDRSKDAGTSCQEAGCHCRCYRYIPNSPEEIGEGWLSRRRGWDPAKWSPKCRCGHGAREHDPLSSTCRSCRCAQFASHFLCVVCDQPWEAHVTVFESEAERLRCGRPVREAYFPLQGVDWEVRQLVLRDATGGGVLAPPPPSRPSATVQVLEDSGDAVALPDGCRFCATIFRSPQSNFCHKCGRARHH